MGERTAIRELVSDVRSINTKLDHLSDRLEIKNPDRQLWRQLIWLSSQHGEAHEGSAMDEVTRGVRVEGANGRVERWRRPGSCSVSRWRWLG